MINIALIGCGRVSEFHCKAIKKQKKLKLIACCDLDIDKANYLAKKYKAKSFSNYNEMLENLPQIDIVAIITPSGMHYQHAKSIINKYKKNLIIEKPVCLKTANLINLFKIAKNKKVKIYSVFQNRYNKAVQRVKKAIKQNELGDIRVIGVRVRWCRPQRYYDLAEWRGTLSHDGGALTNQGIHHVDLLRYLGGEVDKVNATMRTLGANIEAEDTVVSSFTYRNKVVGSLEVTTAARPDDYEASISIVGSSGLAQIGGIAVNELQIFTPEPESCEKFSEDFSDCVYGDGHKILYEDIFQSITNNEPYSVSRNDCLQSIRLLHAFYRSDEKNNWQEVNEDGESFRLGMENNKISNLYRTNK